MKKKERKNEIKTERKNERKRERMRPSNFSATILLDMFALTHFICFCSASNSLVSILYTMVKWFRRFSFFLFPIVDDN
jgi:hypothetical protein